MSRLLSFMLIMLVVGGVSAQSYSDAFDRAFANDDILAQREALELWRRDAPNDVNLFIARYNHYANRAMLSSPSVDERLADSALMAVEEGIGSYPNRLDLYMGKIFFLGQIGRWDAFEQEILRMLNLWSGGGLRWEFPNMEDGMGDLVAEAVSDYMLTMMEAIPRIPDEMNPLTADTVMAMRIRRVAKRTVQLMPRYSDAYRVLGLSYIDVENERALKYLLRAEELEPDNAAGLYYLSVVCSRLGRESQAREYRNRLDALGE